MKFDEDDCGLYMDFRLKEGEDWQRVKPEQATAANKKRKSQIKMSLGEDELRDLLSEEE